MVSPIYMNTALALTTVFAPSLIARKASSFRKDGAAPSAQSTSQSNAAQVAVIAKVSAVDPKSFIVSMRKAKTREAQVAALSSYTVYDCSQPIGAQIDNAMRKAMAELKPVSKVIIDAAPVQSAVGYVAGMPNHAKRKVQDLLGREAATILLLEESICNQNNMNLPAQKRIFGAQSAKKHAESLAAIRAELAELAAV